MNNNDILIRLRYALDIKDSDMVKIFALGGITVTREELAKILIRQEEDTLPDETIDAHTLESFLNGFITFKRGEAPAKNGVKPKPSFIISDQRSVNNVMMKKIKIALSFTTDDVLDVLELAGVHASSSEIGAILRKEGHRNYKACGDRYARNFLKGIGMDYRK
jgi:uncharacterized protein YehS (DUF1456 family)